MSDLLDIGNYANDTRLVKHDWDHASFYGERCMPAVYVDRSPGSGFHAYQANGKIQNGVGIELRPVVFADAPTAAEALRQIIGPVIPR